MPSFWLEINQNGAVQNYPFNQTPITIGRERGVDLVLDHPTVSRQHGQIVHDGQQGYRLVVLSVSGLTAVDQTQVSGEVPLYDGSIVNFGQMTFTFRAHDASPRPADAGMGALDADDEDVAGFGMQDLDALAEGPQKSKPSNVWEEIAQSAEALEEEERTDEENYYKRMEAAQQRGEEKSKGTNPLLILGVVAAIGFVGYTFLPNSNAGPGAGAQQVEEIDVVPVELKDVTCLGKEECIAEAKARYKVGKEMLVKRDVNITNLFEGYKKMLEAKQLLEIGQADVPASMEDIDTQIEDARQDLDKIFSQQRLRYHKYKKRKMYGEVLEAIDTVDSYFPDKTTPEQRWVNEKTREMKRLGVYN